MQNERSGSNSRRRDAAAQRRLQLQEASSNNEEELEAGVPHLRTGSVRSHSVGPRRQSLRGSYSGHGRAEPPPGSEEPADTGPSNSQPPALEYYRPSDEECEDVDMADADEIMAEDESDVPAEKSTAELTDISDSEDEIIDEQDEEEGDMDDSALQQQQQDGSSGRRKSLSSCKSKPAASAAAVHGQASTLLGSNSKRRSQKHQQQQSSASASTGASASSSRHHQQQSRKRSSKRADLEQQQPAEEEQEQEKEQLEEFDCSSEQYAVDIKRLRESKLKHNKNEQMRRKDMKEAVHRLRNQLRRKTKKPSTISVLKAAKQEIDELTAIKVEEEKELERLRKRELFLKYQLESLVSDRNQRLSTGGSASVLVSPVCPGVVGPTASFLPPTAAPGGAINPPPPLPPTPPQPLPPSIDPRPPHAQYPSLFSAVLPPPPPAIPYSGTAAASSPTAIGRLGVIPDRPQQHVAAHASSAGLSSIHPRLPIPLPQPPTLIPAAAIAAHFSNPSTPPSAGGGGGGGGVSGRGLSAPPTAAATPGAATISIFPAPPPGSTAVIPGGLAPLHLLQPRTTTNTVAAAQQLYTGFPSAPIIMSYPGIAAAAGRHPSPTTPIVGPPGLTASPHHHPAIGRLTMAPTFPFYLPTALRPPTMPAATGLGAAHYSPAATAASAASSQPGSTRHVQLLASAGLPSVLTSSSDHSMARRSSDDDGGGDRSVRSTDADSERHRHRSSTGTGSKNGVVSAETYIPSGPHTQSPSRKAVGNAPSVREVSAESRRVAGSLDNNGVCVITVVDSRESDEYRLRPAKRSRNNNSNIDDDDDSCLRSEPTMEKRQRLFNRYNRNGVVSVEKNISKKHLLSAAPPLLKMIDSVETDHGTSDEKWSEDRQQFVRERRADRNRYHHHHQCTLPPPPALRNAEVISTVIKHIQPRRETVSSSMVTGVDYGDHEKEFELCNGVEEPRYRGGGGGEQRYRVSNSLSSSDECPDSPLSQQNFTNRSAEQSMCSCNKKIGRDGVYVQVASHCKHSSSSTEVGHRGNSQHRSSRKKKSNSYLHRPNHGYHSIAVLQTTT